MGGKRHHQQRKKGGIGTSNPYERIAMAVVDKSKDGAWDDLPVAWQTKILVAVLDAEKQGAKAMSAAAQETYAYLRRVKQLTSSGDEDD